jgi:hypothetical protein
MELELRGEDDRAMVLLETGRIAEYREAIGALQRLAAEMRAPWARRLAAARQATLALLGGRFADAEALAESRLHANISAEPWDGVVVARVQLSTLCSEDGRLAQMEPVIRRAAEQFLTRPLFRCLLAQLLAELGEEAQSPVRIRAAGQRRVRQDR